MSEDKSSKQSENLRLYAHALRETVVHVAGSLNVLRRAYERWVPVSLPPSVKSVLFVCKGNICRSPMAEAYFHACAIKAGSGVVIRSAGLETTPGKPAHSHARTVAQQQQLSLNGHVTRLVHGNLLVESDLIVVMEIRQKDRLHRLYPETKGKVVLLGYFNPAGPIEIADPFGGPIEEFQQCFVQVKQACDTLASRLLLDNGLTTAGSATPLGA